MNDPSEPYVYLVGAGPGNPGLLTLRALEVLATADVVLYDQLVPKRILDFANPNAETICVRELPGNHPDKYPHIHILLAENAKKGKRVVRLKGGDPLVFGRGGEEAEALRAAGVAYEIVPGVTAALAAAAYLDMPLTHRNYASAIAFVTGHELPTKPGNKLDWRALANFPGTLAIYMGIARLPLIVAELLKFGKAPTTPAAIIERASTGDMRTVISTLGGLEESRRHAGLESPGLILVGDAVGQRTERSWFESRPLFGQRVLVTRPKEQAAAMLRRLELLGAVPYLMPTVEIRDPDDFGPVDAAIDAFRTTGWDWILFTSANGVHRFFQRLFARGRDVRDLGRTQIAAVGPKTAEALRTYHLKPDFVPGSGYSAASLAVALKHLVAGKRVLFPKANRGRDVIRDELSQVATLEAVTVYDQVDAVEPASEIFDALRRGEIRYVTLTSSNIAKSFLTACDDTIRDRVARGEIDLITISEETTAAVEAMGCRVIAQSAEATTESMIRELVRLASERTEASEELS